MKRSLVTSIFKEPLKPSTKHSYWRELFFQMRYFQLISEEFPCDVSSTLSQAYREESD